MNNNRLLRTKSFTERDKSLDLLRFIALSGIIFIHTLPTSIFLCQIRGFDVPMMVFVAGISYMVSSMKHTSQETYYQYCYKRFKRLILPALVFMGLYFSVRQILGTCGVIENVESIGALARHFTFTTGWYTWIIRTLFLISQVAPLLNKLMLRVEAIQETTNVIIFKMGGGKYQIINYINILIVFVTIAAFERIALLSTHSIYQYIVMCIPYISFFYLGMNISKFRYRELIAVTCVALFCYLFKAWTYYCESGTYQLTSIEKYPPRLYYTSYALMLVLLLYMLRNKIVILFHYLHLLRLATYIGSHTIWIYFWHIPCIDIANEVIYDTSLRYLFVYTCALFITYLQTILVFRIMDNVQDEKLRKNLKILFVG